ncbi:MAG: HAMP domain-containing histidine kinase [Chloroflexia bacterium]|nr:HAMP domain-containing histidine kinase [Chloroflexia bacterium]
MLDWAMAQTGKTEYKPESISLEELVQNSLEITAGSSQAKQIKVFHNLDEKICVHADKNMINTVLSNLVTNAIKYTKRNGKVEISAIKSDGFVKVLVADSGIGIDPDKLGTLFKITEKKSTLGTEKEKGTGLGLILCKDFIDKHGGEIGAEPRAKGGSTFWFTLPLSI